MTNETKEKATKDKGASLYSVKLLLVVALAFIAAITFRRSAGIIAMTPISLLMCAAAAFIGISTLAKCSIFGITVFAINTIENDDINVAIMFSALCLLAIAVFSLAVQTVKKGKKYGYSIGIIGVIVCIGLNIFFVGNPFTAIKAKDKITSYTDVTYPQSENAYLGNFEFSKIYYRYDTKAYVIDAVSDKYPTEGASLTLGNEVIRDGFKSLMEEKLSEPYVLDIKSVLRDKFPNDSFSVTFDGFASLPDDPILASGTGELKNNLYYEITLGGVQTGEQMRERVRDYVNALDESGVGYAKLVFVSGIGNWQRRYVSIDPNHITDRVQFDVKFVSKDTYNGFNRYLEKVIFD